MPSRKINRKARKSNRKTLNRKNRKTLNRKNRKTLNRKNYKKSTRRQQGGSSLTQGQEFASFHKNQHGGALTGAPISAIDSSMLPAELRSFARVDGIDASVSAASHMRDSDQVHAQVGGRRKMRSKTRSNSRSKSRSKSRAKKQRGGAFAFTGAPLSQSNMLLSATDAAKAGTADFRDPLLKL